MNVHRTKKAPRSHLLKTHRAKNLFKLKKQASDVSRSEASQEEDMIVMSEQSDQEANREQPAFMIREMSFAGEPQVVKQEDHI
jgi:hypothetical protein